MLFPLPKSSFPCFVGFLFWLIYFNMWEVDRFASMWAYWFSPRAMKLI
jgi:hypothetical protein